MERWVVNASPIICLAKAGYSDLLFELPDEVLIPDAVIKEIQFGPSDDPARNVISSGKVPIENVRPLNDVIAWDLGIGETAVISFVLANPGWTAIIDDLAARKCARSFSIPVKGTLAIVMLAKKRGVISSAAEVLRALKISGIRLDDELIRTVLKQTLNEDW